MRKVAITACIILINILTTANIACGQERVGPIRYNPFMNQNRRTGMVHKPTQRKTSHILTLPFFEDFTGYNSYPDSNKWVDFEAYINNEMCVSPISRGVATLDDLDANGIPYDSFSNTTLRYADSLTSQPIDLSNNFPHDSLYLSFFYQPQGNGFYPLVQDSLQLYLKDIHGNFVMVWSDTGALVQPFRQVMVAVVDSPYFHNNFQFRFVNRAAMYWADAVWNIDYVRLDTSRNLFDTAIRNIGFSSDAGFMLNDYTSMPYRQFYANIAGERAAQYADSIRNNYNITQLVNYGTRAMALNTGTVLQPDQVISGIAVGPYSIQQFTNTTYTTTIPLSSVGIDDKVVFENTCYIQSISPADPPDNDTIVRDQVFDNYLAYDDGTAEKSYYLNLFPTEPGKIAIEFHLNQPDTMRGMAIYFGRQVPFPNYKTFAIDVYSALKGIYGAPTDILLGSQDFYIPAYTDTINHFWIYTFDNPLPLPAGTFFAGTMQDASSGDDSIYFGLDVNRIGSNHAFFNVINSWTPSLISGAIMMRPLLGKYVSGTGIADINTRREDWEVMPNPAIDKLQLKFNENVIPDYKITDVQGRTIMTGKASNNTPVDVSQLKPGMYFINLVDDGIPATPKKIIKL